MKTPGRHADGAGLYLVVEPSGSKRWAFIFRWREPGTPGAGKLREMGLGSCTAVSLATAREKAASARTILDGGQDPIAVRQSKREIPTFGLLADQFVTDLSPQWRNDKHIAQWKMTLEGYAEPIRAKRVDVISTEDVLGVLRPIWTTKAETASRVRGRIERVLDAAKAKGFRSGENPARWRGHLDHLLPKRQRLARGHHRALAYSDMPKFMARLRSHHGSSIRALEFLILTAARSGEVVGATWDEIDLKAKTWTVPAARMKAGRVHRVPLSTAAASLLQEQAAIRSNDFVFAGEGKQGCLSSMAMTMVLRRMDVEATVHGFRSSFRDWAGEETTFPRDVAEEALAHSVGNAVERAYRRGDALEKRRSLMEAWAVFCEPKEAKVVSMVQRR